MIQEEICPWENCGARITVSCGERRCPACGNRISVSPDQVGLNLIQLLRTPGLGSVATELLFGRGRGGK